MQAIALIVIFLFVIAASMVVAPRRASLDGFFGGRSALGQAPSLWVLVLSQVTTWIFARSLMNSAILGYYYGIAGTLAYAAYYAFIPDRRVYCGALARRRGAVGSGLALCAFWRCRHDLL